MGKKIPMVILLDAAENFLKHHYETRFQKDAMDILRKIRNSESCMTIGMIFRMTGCRRTRGDRWNKVDTNTVESRLQYLREYGLIDYHLPDDTLISITGYGKCKLVPKVEALKNQLTLEQSQRDRIATDGIKEAERRAHEILKEAEERISRADQKIEKLKDRIRMEGKNDHPI